MVKKCLEVCKSSMSYMPCQRLPHTAHAHAHAHAHTDSHSHMHTHTHRCIYLLSLVYIFNQVFIWYICFKLRSKIINVDVTVSFSILLIVWWNLNRIESIMHQIRLVHSRIIGLSDHLSVGFRNVYQIR